MYNDFFCSFSILVRRRWVNWLLFLVCNNGHSSESSFNEVNFIFNYCSLLCGYHIKYCHGTRAADQCWWIISWQSTDFKCKSTSCINIYGPSTFGTLSTIQRVKTRWIRFCIDESMIWSMITQYIIINIYGNWRFKTLISNPFLCHNRKF